MKQYDSRTSLALRYRLAQKAFRHTAAYDATISEYLADTVYENVEKCYSFETQ